jgi:hypothetical protein
MNSIFDLNGLFNDLLDLPDLLDPTHPTLLDPTHPDLPTHIKLVIANSRDGFRFEGELRKLYLKKSMCQSIKNNGKNPLTDPRYEEYFEDEYPMTRRRSRKGRGRRGRRRRYKRKFTGFSYILRHDPILVQCVEELGNEGNIDGIKLKIVKIPSEFEKYYYISSYEFGHESVEIDFDTFWRDTIKELSESGLEHHPMISKILNLSKTLPTQSDILSQRLLNPDL